MKEFSTATYEAHFTLKKTGDCYSFVQDGMEQPLTLVKKFYAADEKMIVCYFNNSITAHYYLDDRGEMDESKTFGFTWSNADEIELEIKEMLKKSGKWKLRFSQL